VLNNTKTQSRPKLLFLVPAISQTHKSLENSQDFFVKTKTKTKTFTSRPRPRLRLWISRPRPRPRLYFLSSRRLETKTLVSRTTSLPDGYTYLTKTLFARWHLGKISAVSHKLVHMYGITYTAQMWARWHRNITLTLTLTLILNPNPKSKNNICSKRRHQNKVAHSVLFKSYFPRDGVNL